MKIMTKITTILILSIFLFSCKKECKTINDFLVNKPIYENAKMVTYGQVGCDMFLVTIEYFDGSRKKIYMTFNHKIISEQ